MSESFSAPVQGQVPVIHGQGTGRTKRRNRARRLARMRRKQMQLEKMELGQQQQQWSLLEFKRHGFETKGQTTHATTTNATTTRPLQCELCGAKRMTTPDGKMYHHYTCMSALLPLDDVA